MRLISDRNDAIVKKDFAVYEFCKYKEVGKSGGPGYVRVFQTREKTQKSKVKCEIMRTRFHDRDERKNWGEVDWSRKQFQKLVRERFERAMKIRKKPIDLEYIDSLFSIQKDSRVLFVALSRIFN